MSQPPFEREGGPVIIQAIIPSIYERQVVLQAGTYPQAEHIQGSGTTEDTLRQLGLRAIGTAIFPHYAFRASKNLLCYITKPVDPARVRLAEATTWFGLDYRAELTRAAQELKIQLPRYL